MRWACSASTFPPALRNGLRWGGTMVGASSKYESAELSACQIQHVPEIRAPSATYVSLLQECRKRQDLVQGKFIHNHIIQRGLIQEVFICNHLIAMYNNCSCPMDARQVFDSMPAKNVVTWNAMIGGYAQAGYVREAFNLYHEMLQQGMLPNHITFITMLNVCACSEMLAVEKLVHGHIVDAGLDSDLVIGNALINALGKCGSPKAAHRIFSEMRARNVISWTSLITVYTREGLHKQALKLFQQMQQEGIKPNKTTFVIILTVCSSLEHLALGKLVHSQIMDAGAALDVALANTLITMYGRCGMIEDARRIFDSMVRRNVVSWTSMIALYSKGENVTGVFKLFQEMLHEDMMPNKVTLISILDACASSESLSFGKLVHAYLIDQGLELDVLVGTTLVHMYAKFGDTPHAHKTFAEMPVRNVVSWNVMIAAYAQCGQYEEAYGLFYQMVKSGLKPDRITFIHILNSYDCPECLALGKVVHAYIVDEGAESDVLVCNALVNMYGKCRNMSAANMMFEKIHEQDIVSWNSIIVAYAQHGYFEEVFHTLHLLKQSSIKPNEITFVSTLNACVKPEFLSVGRQVHAYIIDEGCELHVAVGNSLVNMYGTCGSIQEAQKVFDKMPERDVFSWTSLIAAYAQHGCGKEALQLFQQMEKEGAKPDKVTFISVLNACNHAGLVDEGLHYFNSMTQDHGISPTVEHYNCIIDLLGRAGNLDEAQSLILAIPVRSNVVIWMTLLDSCKFHGFIVQGKGAAEQALELNPQLASVYIMLSDIYAIN